MSFNLGIWLCTLGGYTRFVHYIGLRCHLQVVLAVAHGKGARESVSSATDFDDSYRYEDIKRVCFLALALLSF